MDVPLTGSIIQVKKFGGGTVFSWVRVRSAIACTVMNQRPPDDGLPAVPVGDNDVLPSGKKRKAAYL